MICTRLHPGHLSVRVGDGSRRSEEIVKKYQIAPLNAIIIIIIIISSSSSSSSMKKKMKKKKKKKPRL